LEEIFIKLANDSVRDQNNEVQYKFFGLNFSKLKKRFTNTDQQISLISKQLKLEQLEEYSSYTKLRVSNNCKLIFQQFYALLIKRYHRVKRNVKGFIAEIVVPIVYVCLALLVATLIPSNDMRPELELHPWHYSSSNKMFLSKGLDLNTGAQTFNESIRLKIERINNVTDTFFSSPGPGSRCLNGHDILVQKFQRIKGFNEKKRLICHEFDSKLYSNVTMLSSLNAKKNGFDCDCSSGFPECPTNLVDDYIKNKKATILKTYDHIYDISGSNVTDWIIKTEFTKTFFKKRYGGFEFNVKSKNISSSLILELFSDFSKFSNNFVNLLNIATLQNQSMSPVEYLNNLEFVGSNSLYADETVKIWYNSKGYDSR
jgi:ATP-binding cassette, subfamily A (ABC1), member 1